MMSCKADRIGDEIAVTAANLEAAEYVLIAKIGELDARDGWMHQGAISCAQWLSWKIGLGLVQAREKVRVARSAPTRNSIRPPSAVHAARRSLSARATVPRKNFVGVQPGVLPRGWGQSRRALRRRAEAEAARRQVEADVDVDDGARDRVPVAYPS